MGMHISAVVIVVIAAFVCLLTSSVVVTNTHQEKGLHLLSFKKLIVPVKKLETCPRLNIIRFCLLRDKMNKSDLPLINCNLQKIIILS